MNPAEEPLRPGRLIIAIGLVSMAMIAYQICLMQILSIVQWHHFASTIIAVALLGFGASGTCIALMKDWMLSRYEPLMPGLMAACGLTMVLAVWAAQGDPIRFDSYLIFTEPWHIRRLAFTCLIYFIPFFLGALAIGLTFVRYAPSIKYLYCANLIGSGIGAGLAVILMRFFPPRELPALTAFLPILAGTLIIKHAVNRLAAGLSLGLVLFFAYRPPLLVLSEFKDLKRALDLPEAAIISSRNSPMGLLEIVKAPALRYAPGLSLSYQGDLPIFPMVFKNGDSFGPLLSWTPSVRHSILDYTTGAVAYALARPEKVLVLDAGTGSDVVQGLINAGMVDAVEPHPVAAGLLRGLSADQTCLRVYSIGARTFLRRGGSSYDLIVLPMANTFGGASGIPALAENHLLTIEAFMQMWHRLNPGGMLSVSCWLDTPPRADLKLVATASTVLGRLGAEPEKHLLAVKGWGTFTMVVKRSDITRADIQNANQFCERLAFDMQIPVGSGPSENRAYGPRREEWSMIAASLIAGRGASIPYDFDIRPATDDRPYFSQFLTVRSLGRLKALYGGRMVPFFELGYLILILTTMLVSVLAVVLILLPLARNRPSWPMYTLFYFGGLGVGYLMLEIAFIQHAMLFLGTPMYAAAFVIGGMLFFSGCGSLAAPANIEAYRIIPAAIAALVLIYAFVLAPVLSMNSALSILARVIIMLVAIAPLAFCQGMPFPLGISRLPQKDVPWAWGVNGCLSVMSAPLASIIAVESGFSRVMLFSALAYAAAALALRLKRYA